MDETKRVKTVFQKFYAELITALPISDLLPEFFANDLLSGDLKAKIESRSTPKEQTEYFLDEVIRRGLDIGYTEQFNKMIIIMGSSSDHVTRFLAKQILAGTDDSNGDSIVF